MSIINYFAYAYCGMLLYLLYKLRRSNFSFTEARFLGFLIPIIPVLFFSNHSDICNLRCIILSLPVIFFLFSGISDKFVNANSQIVSTAALWIGWSAVECGIFLWGLDTEDHLIGLTLFYALVTVVFIIFMLAGVRNIKIADCKHRPAYVYSSFLIKVFLDMAIIGVIVACFRCEFNIVANIFRFVISLSIFILNMGYVYYRFSGIKGRNIKIKQVNKSYEISDEGVTNMLKDGGWSDIDEFAKEDAKIIYALLKLFEIDKPYRQYDIKVQDVASLIGTNKTYLSRALNRRLSKNFSQFVNTYRIKDVCEAFINNPNTDIRDIADNYGFNSHSNFSIVFKCIVGYTPSDWCKEVRKRVANNEQVSLKDYVL
ncbi:MAG: helix-turn-helix transcriptional regulator [Bacteroidales bacterium]|nr:helix-turn-helix transcriptional regulator [Bacteroidales bacterium]